MDQKRRKRKSLGKASTSNDTSCLTESSLLTDDEQDVEGDEQEEEAQKASDKTRQCYFYIIPVRFFKITFQYIFLTHLFID